MLQLVLVLVLWSIYCSQVTALMCYADFQTYYGTPSLIVVKNPADDGACARYEYLCTKDDTGCKPAEVGKFKWHYVPVGKGICEYLEEMQKQLSRTRNVMCCTTDKCNAPDPKLDKVTKLLSDLVDGPPQSQPPK
jgi:hypothetical protein